MPTREAGRLGGQPAVLDALVRQAAFEHVHLLTNVHSSIGAEALKEGFIFAGQRIPLVNPRRGIFKPPIMQWLLSIKTVFPKPGGHVWYDDQREIHSRLFGADEEVSTTSWEAMPTPPITGGCEMLFSKKFP
jgi:putative restriction endonuclease